MVVIDKAKGRIIGSSRYNAVDADASTAEIGWFYLSRPYWGRGCGGQEPSAPPCVSFRGHRVLQGTAKPTHGRAAPWRRSADG